MTSLGAVTIASLALAAAAYWWRPAAVTPVYRTSVVPPDGVTLSLTFQSQRYALSPNGRLLVFVGSSEGATHLYTRALDATTATAMPGTENATAPFWSPDSSVVAFFDNRARKLKRVTVMGGPATVVCDMPGTGQASGAAWDRTAGILFGIGTPGVSAIYHVKPTGGTPRPVTKVDTASGETAHGTPSFLPDGHSFIFTYSTAN